MFKLKQFKNKIKKKYLWRKCHDMAYFFCKGRGLEVGALSSPYTFNTDCKLEYADIYDNDKLREILKKIPYDNLYKNKLVKVKHILKPPKYFFDDIENETFEFVYSSHSLEHTSNPIATLTEQLRITKSNGIVYTVIPNKKNTYDRLRKVTPSNHLIKKFENDIYDHTVEEAMDVIKNSDNHELYNIHKKRAEEYAKEMIEKKEGIHHYHTFDETNTMEMVIYITKKNNAYLEYFSGFQERDIHFAIRKL
jgi:SAM-dependent methyltransferase|tara:strand:+ start:557 stop:1306 length:750 start_codon:yes stop_codon:yes gene_type:complete